MTSSEHPGIRRCNLLQTFLFVGAIGLGGIGLGIDALKSGRTTLYEAPDLRAAALSFRW